MKTLLFSNPPPLFFPGTTHSNPKALNLHLMKIQNSKPQTPARKIQANAKGFNTTSKEPSGSSDRKNKIAENNNDDEPIPDEVFERMIVRILVSVGVPMATGVAILKILGMVKDNNIWDVPLWVPFSTTLVTFGASALGIAYGSLSTSLDPQKKGSVLGFKEAQQNWVEMWREENDT